MDRSFLFVITLFLGFSVYSQQPVPSPEKSPLISPGVGAYTEDPKKILRAAGYAVRSIQSLKYDAAYQGNGAMSTRSLSAVGKMSLSRLPSGNPLKAKLAASGTSFPGGSDEKLSFHTVFDGSTVRRLRPKDKTVIIKTLSAVDPRERALGFVTSFFGGGPYHLLMLEYLLDAPFKRQGEAPVADYEGRTAVEGVLCHVIYVEHTPDFMGRIPRERWFLGVKDNLPRKYELISNDNDGRYGAYVLTLSNLRVNLSMQAKTFTFNTPKGYIAKRFKQPPQPRLLDIGDAAPDWKLIDAAGKIHTLSDYSGKLIVLDFWATWCGPCIRAMPGLQKVFDRFNSRGVEVFGVNVWEESNSVEFLKRS